AALLPAINCEPREQHHADGIGRQPADKLPRRVLTQERSHGEAEEAQDVSASSDNKRSRRIHALRRQRMTLEPVVEFLTARVERRHIVAVVEPLEAQSTRRAHTSCSFDVFLNNSTSSGTALAGLSSSTMKRSNASFESTRSWCCLTTFFARDVTVSSTKAVT